MTWDLFFVKYLGIHEVPISLHICKLQKTVNLMFILNQSDNGEYL